MGESYISHGEMGNVVNVLFHCISIKTLAVTMYVIYWKFRTSSPY